MPERPLLVFPSHGEADRETMSPGFGNISRPNHATQIDRLDTRFYALQKIMENRVAEFQLNPSGIEPEEVLVFEVAGSVTQFLSVCNNTEGIEWLADIETDELTEDELFYSGDEYSEGKPLNGRLLLSLTNQDGINNLLSMWENWKQDEDFEFPYGLNGWKNIFPRIVEIRRWGVKERFEETGIRDNWEFELQHGRDRIPFEIELWFRNSEAVREEVQEKINGLVNDSGGSLLDSIIIPEIRYHGLLVDMPSETIHHLLDDHNIELVKCDQIMFFRPTGQSVPKIEVDDEEEREEVELEVEEPEESGIEIALLDGLPIQNHQVLRDHLVIDDPDNFEEGYPVRKREHGTSMSSIIINGDLNNSTKLSKRIYTRPILRYDSISDEEKVPSNRLLVELLYSSIRRIFEGDNGETPVAPEVKVINLSIGDPFRPFYNELSSVARLLDWFCFRYNVLFLVSAGNNRRDIVIKTNGQSLEDLADETIQEKTLLSIYEDRRNRRLISPAESINSITVGAAHHDNSVFQTRRLQYDLIQNSSLPSPVNPIGSGFKRSVKPEIIMPGGKTVYRFQNQDNGNIYLRTSNFVSQPPGLKVAYPGDEGNLGAVAYTSGTSNATAMATNFAGHIIEVLDELNEEYDQEIPREFYSVLIKTLIGHTSSWGEIETYLRQVFRDTIPTTKIKDGISKIIGFGNLAQNRAYECDVNRASIIGFGSLERNKAHIYDFPIPPALSGRIKSKKLIITLAWFSPINPGRQNYRKAHLYFDPDQPMERLNLERDETYAYTAKRGTLQHEILVGSTAVPVVEGDELKVRVNCRQDAGILNESVKYGLCVTLESSDAIPIYQQVRERVAIPVEIRAEN